MRGLRAGQPPTSPEHYAEKVGRRYLTPEDVVSAYVFGGTREEAWESVLRAVDARGIEDASLCAFIALNGPSGSGGWPAGASRKGDK